MSYIFQEDLNGLNHDLYLCKQQSKFLIFRLKQWSTDKEGVNISSFKTRNNVLAPFFNMENRLYYCKNVRFVHFP